MHSGNYHSGVMVRELVTLTLMSQCKCEVFLYLSTILGTGNMCKGKDPCIIGLGTR